MDASTTRPQRLSRSTITRYAIGSLGTGGYGTLPGLVLTYFLTDNLGVAALTAGLIVGVAKVWDVIIDPWIGAASDRQLARTGSRRGFMVIGSLTIPIFFALTFAVPPSFGPTAGAISVLLAFLATATAFSLFQVPFIAISAELTDSYNERTRLIGWRVIVLTLAILLFGAGGPELRDATGDPITGYLLMGIVAGVAIGIAMFIATRTADDAAARAAAQERVAGAAASPGLFAQYAEGWSALRRSQPFRALLGTFVIQALAIGMMLAGAQYIATWVLHSQGAVTLLFLALVGPALIATPAWTTLSRRTGKEKSFVYASLLFIVAAASIVLLIWMPGAWIYAPVALVGVAYAGMQTLPMAMLPDVVSNDERQHGTGRAGTFSGVWTAGETIGLAFGPVFLTVILAISGYASRVAGDTSVMQTDAAITGIVLSFSAVPAILMALSLVPLGRYRLRRADIETAP